MTLVSMARRKYPLSRRILIYLLAAGTQPVACFRAVAIPRRGQVIRMIINRNAFAALIPALGSLCCSGALYADTVATPIDLSANVIESILPGGTIFHDAK